MRLVITGLPCPATAWEELLGPSESQRIITMQEVLANTESSDPRELARYVMEQIEAEKPKSIVAHGMGVPFTLLALLRLKKQGVELESRLTLFNGAFRHASLWRAREPLRIQWTPVRRVIREVQSRGGQVDPGLHAFVPRIRAMYRLLILHRLADKMTSALGLESLGRFPKRAGLKMPIQIIASHNDPYVPFEAMEELRSDLEPDRFIEVDYGHFPYSLPSDRIRPLVSEFECLSSSQA